MGIVLLALVRWLVPLPLPFRISLSGVRVEGNTAAEPAALEAKGWRLCRFLRRTELRGRLRWRRRRERKSTSRWIACGS